ncbi:MAG TPA: hypothetical protein VFG18_00895 [Xanthomonadaceae bacterium]|nr:hypothetical protein [Xanthomonadaceae bacterium]
MDQMIDEFAKAQKGPLPGSLERWSFAIGLLGAGLGLLLGALLGNELGLWAARVGLMVECAGFGVSIGMLVAREWHTFRHAKRAFARELDGDFQKYRTYVMELCRYPAMERARLLRYIRGRRQVMRHRLGLFSGGIERLGVLPVLVVLYLQFRDWQWGDWDMLAEVNLMQGLLLWALLLTYAAGWYLITLHSRIGAYELLLAEAAEQDGDDHRRGVRSHPGQPLGLESAVS